ncbi:MAG: VWA domain-containing protein [Verrucomicrobia bacterium]|nr:VWA domain-containing protein [Verrucomicrobiota bacterium]MCH8511810.1 VWA domain-containing protein [Kiritimatiellia bacterium]
MMFLAPLLAGLAALAVLPVLIHLLLKRKPRLIQFAAIEFILRSLRKTKRRMQHREMIILALRTLAILLTALAMSRPTLTGDLRDRVSGGETLAVLVVDNSMSMRTRQGDGTRFTEARRRAARALESLPPNSRAALVYVNDAADAEIPEPTRDLTFVANQLDNAPVTDAASDLLSGLETAVGILENHAAAGREILLLSDFQASGFPGPDSQRMQALVTRLQALSPAPGWCFWMCPKIPMCPTPAWWISVWTTTCRCRVCPCLPRPPSGMKVPPPAKTSPWNSGLPVPERQNSAKSPRPMWLRWRTGTGSAFPSAFWKAAPTACKSTSPGITFPRTTTRT